ncbi:hypothetical protein SAMN06265221_1221 [Paracoccus laeviglucosivorans]|uniref:Uncharacterized protein n=2 Tax=Paracoccus laeviglucosivorans TaxID=1197861 RepID=A0A521FH29_9RHOB|nr:hypothetical protein SAMN06265221_1221 [Paracoccus laeviglucosivorans]
MERRYTVPEVSKAAGIAARTVDNMRKRLREMQIEGREPTGDWHRDKRLPPVDDGGAILTDAQRKKGIADLTKAIRDLLDRRKHIGMPILRDAGAVDDALIEALGEKRIVALYDYLHGEGDEYDYDEVPDDDAEDRLRADYAF